MPYPYKTWKRPSDGLTAIQALKNHHTVVIYNSKGDEVDRCHTSYFMHEILNSSWFEADPEPIEVLKEESEVLVESRVTTEPEFDPFETHVGFMLLQIDEFLEEQHPIRHSNHYLFLKKHFKNHGI